MDFVWLLIGVVIGAVAVWFYLNGQHRARLEAREAELMQETRRAEEAAEAERKAHDQTRQAISDVEARETAALENVASLTSERDAAGAELEREKSGHQATQKSLSDAETAKAAAVEQAESLSSEQAAIREQLERAKAGEADKAAKLDELKTASEDLKARHDAAENRLKEVQAEAAAAGEGSHARINELQERLNQRDQDIRKLEAELAEPPARDQEAPSVSAAPAEPAPAPAAPPEAPAVQPAPAEISLVADSPADDLTKIKGIGAVLKEKLAGLGITTFRQIADFTEADIERVNGELDFPGRIEREQWIEQARAMVNW